MGHGYWKREQFEEYSSSVGRKVERDGSISGIYSNQQMFRARTLDRLLNPRYVVRECCDTKEHPNTIPVILALDVTGSMGQSAVEVAKKLNVIMTELYDRVQDVEFMIMGIGDLTYDKVPIQISQFESDIRIAEQLDKLYFEFGGGGNNFESYTAAWYMASRHTKLDCWKRGKKGIIITIGDERLNPYLPVNGNFCGLAMATGDCLQADVETTELYKEVIEKYDLFHLDVNHRWRFDKENIKKSFLKYLDEKHFREVTLDSITDEIIDIVLHGQEVAKKEQRYIYLRNGIRW